MSELTVLFLRYVDGEPRQYFCKGRVAQSLICLVQAGDSGITSLEVSCWALRLAAYVHTLRHDYGLNIHTQREPHEGGMHARYILETPVEIVQIVESK